MRREVDGERGGGGVGEGLEMEKRDGPMRIMRSKRLIMAYKAIKEWTARNH